MINVKARCLDSNQVCGVVVCMSGTLGKNERTLITLLETVKAGPFLKFTSQGVTNGSVCG